MERRLLGVAIANVFVLMYIPQAEMCSSKEDKDPDLQNPPMSLFPGSLHTSAVVI